MDITGTSTLNQHGNERFHGLDSARALALLIGIFHHGIESFVTYTKGDWITQDSQSSLFIDIVFYVSHVFRMQAFFLMSGFFAHLLFSRNGARGFVINRAKRLLLPFVLFWPVLYTITYTMWVWGIQHLKHCAYDEAVAQLPGYMIWSKGFPLMHLWFLYFLILFCSGVVITRPIVVHWIDRSSIIRKRADTFICYCMNRWWGSMSIGVFMIVPMLGMTDWFGVDTSASGLVPRLAPFILYGMYFTLGWFIYRQTDLLKTLSKFRLVNLIFSIFFIVSVIVLSLVFANPDPLQAPIILAVINTLYAFASVTTVFAFMGYCMFWFSKPSNAIRYLSNASYWGYLIHLPLVGFFQIIVAPLNLFWGLKLLIIFIPAFLFLFLSYNYGVRRTFLGVLLNGSKK